MKKCNECRSSVANDAFRCPRCGHQLRTHGCAALIAFPVIACLVIYLVLLWESL